MLEKYSQSQVSSNSSNQLNSFRIRKQTLDEEEKSHTYADKTLGNYYIGGHNRSNSANVA